MFVLSLVARLKGYSDESPYPFDREGGKGGDAHRTSAEFVSPPFRRGVVININMWEETMMKRMTIALVVALVALLAVSAVTAQEPTYDDVKAKFAGTTLADWPGYEKEPFCVDARLIGQPELGAMGWHAINPALLDLEVNPLEPEVLLLDADDNVIAVEYMVPSQEKGQPELFGRPFDESEPHPPAIMQPHYDLHTWFVGDPAARFAPFNPAVALCPEGTLPPPPPAMLPKTGGTDTTWLPLAGLLALVGGVAMALGFALRRHTA